MGSGRPETSRDFTYLGEREVFVSLLCCNGLHVSGGSA
jgi:hypothetical protein